MLYLNVTSIKDCEIEISHLTLTSVVFEWEKIICLSDVSWNLTLTSVVFEFKLKFLVSLVSGYLTLTSVVFE